MIFNKFEGATVRFISANHNRINIVLDLEPTVKQMEEHDIQTVSLVIEASTYCGNAGITIDKHQKGEIKQIYFDLE